MIENIELARLVKLYPILLELPPRQQRSIYDSGYTVRLKAGEVVFDANRPIRFFLFLTSGSIRVIHLGQERELMLYRVRPGEICILSMCHLLAGTPYMARAFAEQAVTGVALSQAHLIQIVEGSPLFCSYLFGSISARLAELLALMEAISFSRLDQRLASLLLSKGNIIETTHSQLADELGSVREVISRILKDFESKGLVKLERGKVRVLDRPDLEKIAGSYVGPNVE